MIVKVVEHQFTWKDTGKPHHQYNVYYSTKSSDREFSSRLKRGSRCYPFGWCRMYTFTGTIPKTVLAFLLADDTSVETKYEEYWNSQSGTEKCTTYTSTTLDSRDTLNRG